MTDEPDNKKPEPRRPGQALAKQAAKKGAK